MTTAPTTESLRIDLILRILKMSDDELNSTLSYTLALKTTKKEREPITEVPSKDQVKLEDVNVSQIKRENNSIEEATVTTTFANPLTPLQPNQPNTFESRPPSSTGFEISEDTIAFYKKDDAIKVEPTFSEDVDVWTEFECVTNSAVQLEPLPAVAIVDISST